MPTSDGESLQSPEPVQFEELRRVAHGMLSAEVYHRIYEWARELPPLCDAIEIGAGSGAGTVALAWGVSARSDHARIITIDRCYGGSRLRYGGFRENLKCLRDTLNRYSVAHRVRLLPIDLNDQTYAQVLEILGTRQVGLAILDADGRLDRDLPKLWPYFHERARIVVDDCIERPCYRPVSESHPVGGAKFTLTARIVDCLVEVGWLRLTERIGKTSFLCIQHPGSAMPKWLCRRITTICNHVRLEWLAAVFPDVYGFMKENARTYRPIYLNNHPKVS